MSVDYTCIPVELMARERDMEGEQGWELGLFSLRGLSPGKF